MDKNLFGFLSMAFEGIFELDADGGITDFHLFSGRKIGTEDCVGRALSDILPEAYRERLSEKMANHKAAGVHAYNFIYTDDEGCRLELLIDFSDVGRAALRLVDCEYDGKPEPLLKYQTDILNAMDESIRIIDIHGNQVFTNTGAARLMGGRSEFSPYPPDASERIANEYMPIVYETGSCRFENTIIDAYGQLQPVDQTILTLKNDAGTDIGYATIIKDLSLIRASELELERRLRQQELVAEISLCFTSLDGFEEKIHRTLEQIATFLSADRAYIFREYPEEKCRRCLFDWYAPKLDVSSVSPVMQVEYSGISGAMTQMLSAPFASADDTSELPDTGFEDIKRSDVTAFIFTPIYVNKKRWGTLGAEFFFSTRSWTVSDKNFIQSVSGILSAAIEKREVETDLQKAERNFRNLLENVPVGVYWKDLNLKYQGTNRVFEEYVQKPAFEILGKTDKQVFESQPELGETITNEDRLLAEYGGAIEGTYEFMSRDGSMRWLRAKKLLVKDINGMEPYILGALLDVTASRLAEERMTEALGRAESASSAKSDFLSRMSHEIRTPMNAIIGMNTIASRSDDIERIKYCLDKIDGASKRLLGIINDILDMSKIEANKLEIQLDEFSFEKLLQSVSNVVSVRMDEKRQDFIIDMTSPVSRLVVADELRLSQVLINLLTNASKFTPDDGKIIMNVIFTDLGDDLARLHVDVIDNGIGISEEQMQSLFTSFEQADGGITRKYGGTGLGLAICKRIVELMGGRIWVESELGSGSRFSFEVDVTWGEADIFSSATAQGDPAPGARVLVVDDSEDILFYMSEIMKQFSVPCDIVSSGAEAVQAAREAIDAGTPYSIIFVDWSMPEMDGIETTKLLKSLENSNVVVIMISATQWAEISEAATAAGVDRFIPKPLLPSVLYNTILEISGPTGLDAPGSEDMRFDWSDKYILLAEDIDINREIVCNVLEPIGVNIVEAEDGAIAVEFFKADPDRYDIVLMDIHMPSVDGYRATELIREYERDLGLSRVPIYAMTANAFKEDVERCIAAGMNGHISKPVDFQELMYYLAMHLN